MRDTLHVVWHEDFIVQSFGALPKWIGEKRERK